ncbi:DUF6950 family protein [Phenylobacterium sp.]|uniref:DUF6950 family protein n=1 Tax=Phenylobacterium sp. TaxID=1871053 RepID=UPI0039340ABE
MHETIRRRDAAQAAFDRFNGRALAWGRDDCLRLAAFDLRKMGRAVSLAKAGSYSSLAGALRALRRTGFATLAEAVDAEGLVRIPPAAALPADLLGGTPHEGGPWVALGVVLGNGRVLGFQNGFCGVLQPTPEDLATAIAWRV